MTHGRIAIALALLLSWGAQAEPSEIRGTIKSFECGDNCYLTIETAGGSEVTGLCVAKACRPWNEAAEMPKNLVGRRVAVTIGVGQQLDGSGNLMGDFPAFKTVRVLKK